MISSTSGTNAVACVHVRAAWHTRTPNANACALVPTVHTRAWTVVPAASHAVAMHSTTSQPVTLAPPPQESQLAEEPTNADSGPTSCLRLLLSTLLQLQAGPQPKKHACTHHHTPLQGLVQVMHEQARCNHWPDTKNAAAKAQHCLPPHIPSAAIIQPLKPHPPPLPPCQPLPQPHNPAAARAPQPTAPQPPSPAQRPRPALHRCCCRPPSP